MQPLKASLTRYLGAMRLFVWMNGVTLAFVLGAAIFVVTGRSPFKRLRVIDRLFYDPEPIFDQPYLSLLTHFSEVLWCVAAIACLFAYALLRKLQPQRHTSQFLLVSGIGLLVLLGDDLLRVTLILHVTYGVPRLAMYLIYSIATALYLKTYWRRVLRTPYYLLIIAIAWFGVSAIADIFDIQSAGMIKMLHNVVEDGSKLIGCLHIALYFWQVSLRQVQNAIGNRMERSHLTTVL